MDWEFSVWFSFCCVRYDLAQLWDVSGKTGPRRCPLSQQRKSDRRKSPSKVTGKSLEGQLTSFLLWLQQYCSSFLALVLKFCHFPNSEQSRAEKSQFMWLSCSFLKWLTSFLSLHLRSRQWQKLYRVSQQVQEIDFWRENCYIEIHNVHYCYHQRSLFTWCSSGPRRSKKK